MGGDDPLDPLAQHEPALVRRGRGVEDAAGEAGRDHGVDDALDLRHLREGQAVEAGGERQEEVGEQHGGRSLEHLRKGHAAAEGGEGVAREDRGHPFAGGLVLLVAVGVAADADLAGAEGDGADVGG